MTLNFYSSRAYRFVRQAFDTCLPHPRTLEKWSASVEIKPGCTEHAFAALETKVTAGRGHRKKVALILDKMAIRQQVEWDGNKYHGFIDVGTDLDDDTLPVATEALTFLAVAIDDHWNMPVGYFLIDGLSALERSNLVEKCLCKLHAIGLYVVSLTIDGAASNMAMAKHLGCELDPNHMKSCFSHPRTEKPIFVFLDPCHTLKLVRNSFWRYKGIFLDDSGNCIK